MKALLLKLKKNDWFLISLISFQALICLFSWLVFTKAATDETLIYHSLKSYFIPLELKGALAQSLATIFHVNVSELNIEYFQISFSQLKFKSFYKIIEELSRWLIIIFYGTIYFFISTRKSFLELTYRRILVYSSIFFFIAALSLPNDSSDIYGYIARGAQQLYFDMNPYASVVSEIENWRGNIFLTNMLWENNPAPYGPLFMILCKALVALSLENFWLALFLFKFINLIAYALLIFCIFKICLYIKTDKNNKNGTNSVETLSPKRIFLILAFNPFFMIELAWNGHNDILMCLFISLAFYSFMKGKYGLSLFMISIASLIKFLAIILIPLFIIAFLKICLTRFSSIKYGKAVMELEAVPKSSAYLGFFSGLISSLILILSLVKHYDLINLDYSRFKENLTLSHKSLFNSLMSLAEMIVGANFNEALYYSVLKNLFLSAFIIFAFYVYLKFFMQKRCLLKDSSILMFSLIVLASPKFHSWYLLCFLPFSFLSFPELSLILSFTHLLSFTLVDQANILNFLLMTAFPCLILRGVKK